MGRPKLYDVSYRQICKTCKYWYTYAEMCGYSSAEEECRTVKMGKKRLPKGMCDKYTEGKSSERRIPFNHGII